MVVIAVAYAMVQPTLNRRLGWQLPTLSSFFEEHHEKNVQAANERDDRKQSDLSTIGNQQSEASIEKPGSSLAQREAGTETKTDSSNPASSKDISTVGERSTASNEATQLSEYLKETSRNRFVSPQGLIYGPGSEEGHRLKHIQRHLADQPKRPGKHGVFRGEMLDVVKWIDDAYRRAIAKQRGTSMRREDNRTIVEANFDSTIGYLGGQEGKRLGNPSLRRIRVVLEGQNIITAFPT